MIPERIEIFIQVVVTLLCLAVFLLLLRIVIPRLFTKNKIIQRAKFYDEAKAVILSIELTGFVISQQIQVKLQLQVLPAKRRNFVAEIKEAFPVTALAVLQTGDAMKVKYDPANTKEIFLVKSQ